MYTHTWAWMLILARMLSIIAGKPGSGKSYHMAGIVVDMLSDWVRYELKHGESFDSSIWTNMKFNIEGLNETIGKRVGKDVDVADYIHYCDESFFNDACEVYWWKKFPEKSVIIIDEVHFHLGRKVEYGSLDLEQELINWISTHRHSQQEIYFLSQHTDQFANQILGIADTLLEIVNAKSIHLPFPFNFSMSDLDVLKRSFGIKTQYYQTNIGSFRGKAIKWSGATEWHLMSADIFRAYKSASHGSAEESGGRPDLKMSPFEGLMWFGRKHAWHLVPKLGGIIAVPFIGFFLVRGIPTLLASMVVDSNKVAQVEVVKDESEKKEVRERVESSGSDARAIPAPSVRAPIVDRGVADRFTEPIGSVASGVVRREERSKERN